MIHKIKVWNCDIETKCGGRESKNVVLECIGTWVVINLEYYVCTMLYIQKIHRVSSNFINKKINNVLYQPYDKHKP